LTNDNIAATKQYIHLRCSVFFLALKGKLLLQMAENLRKISVINEDCSALLRVYPRFGGRRLPEFRRARSIKCPEKKKTSCLIPLYQNKACTGCTTIHTKMSFIYLRMKTHFHMEGWTPRLALAEEASGVMMSNNWLDHKMDMEKQYHCLTDTSFLFMPPLTSEI